MCHHPSCCLRAPPQAPRPLSVPLPGHPHKGRPTDPSLPRPGLGSEVEPQSGNRQEIVSDSVTPQTAECVFPSIRVFSKLGKIEGKRRREWALIQKLNLCTSLLSGNKDKKCFPSFRAGYFLNFKTL